MTKTKDTQVVVRFTSELEKRIKRAAEKCGLTKASWIRQTVINALNKEGD